MATKRKMLGMDNKPIFDDNGRIVGFGNGLMLQNPTDYTNQSLDQSTLRAQALQQPVGMQQPDAAVRQFFMGDMGTQQPTPTLPMQQAPTGMEQMPMLQRPSMPTQPQPMPMIQRQPMPMPGGLPTYGIPERSMPQPMPMINRQPLPMRPTQPAPGGQPQYGIPERSMPMRPQPMPMTRRPMPQMPPQGQPGVEQMPMIQRGQDQQTATLLPYQSGHPTMSTLPYNPGNNQSWNDFATRAAAIAQKENFPVQVILGQAALETGRNAYNAPGNNWFGIKGQGNAGSNNLATKEAANGQMYDTHGNFRAYTNPDDSINDYIKLIKTQYPKAYALKDNPSAMIQAIHQGGYATDPNYAQKVMSTPEFRTGAPPQQGQVAGAYTGTPSTMNLASNRPMYGTPERSMARPQPQQPQPQRVYRPQQGQVLGASTNNDPNKVQGIQKMPAYYNQLNDVQNQLDQITRRQAPPAQQPAVRRPIPPPPPQPNMFQNAVNAVGNTAHTLGQDFSRGVGAIGNYFGGLFGGHK